ncbi:MAG: heme exporter protein CcmD [Alphaproteobacteria bacterium]|jgi:heme exporter protein D|nr:heme exporter protein CcmD [Alphaproteobacteria bacterium]
MGDFFSMGGYAGYVWPVYGLAFVVMLGLFVDSRMRLKRAEAEFEALDAARKASREDRP